MELQPIQNQTKAPHLVIPRRSVLNIPPNRHRIPLIITSSPQFFRIATSTSTVRGIILPPRSRCAYSKNFIILSGDTAENNKARATRPISRHSRPHFSITDFVSCFTHPLPPRNVLAPLRRLFLNLNPSYQQDFRFHTLSLCNSSKRTSRASFEAPSASLNTAFTGNEFIPWLQEIAQRLGRSLEEISEEKDCLV